MDASSRGVMEEQPLVKICLILPANVRHRSGGNIYSAKVAESLRAQGVEVSIQMLDGGWPAGSAGDRRLLADALTGSDPPIFIVDGLIATCAPTEIEVATAAGHHVWVLLHMRPSEERVLERRALRGATGVLCTASGTADAVKRWGLTNVRVATPGVDRPENPELFGRRSNGHPSQNGASVPLHFIMVGALLPNKDQIFFVDALARMRDLAWTAALVGSTTADSSYAAAVRERIVRHGFEKRVEVTSELYGSALEEQWLRADLSLLISHSESFGLVVLESLAHGVPVAVRKGTGAVEALGAHGAGEAIDLATGSGSLAELLREWLSDSALRQRWWDAAASAGRALPGWEDTARQVLRAITAG